MARRNLASWLIAIPTVLGLGVPLGAQCPDGSPPPCARVVTRAPAPNSVAVLYFDNLSRDTADAYLADGLTEEIIVRLGQIQRLEVKSRYEVQRFRGRSGGDPAVLGRTLRAASIVSGSVQKAGNRVRVRVELVRTTNRARLWGDVYDRASDDVLGIEEEIARAVVQGIAGQLLPEERAFLTRRPTLNAEAYDLYLRGQALHSRRDEASLRRAIALFEQALALDSTFASAHAGIAQCWIILADDWAPPLEAYPRARRAAERALRVDSGAAEAWASLAMIAYWFDWMPLRAESLARRAIALDPRSSTGHLMRGLALWHVGSPEEASAELLRAYDLDSLSEETAHNVVRGLMHLRRYDAATAMAERYQAASPSSSIAYQEADVYLVEHDCVRALPLLRRARTMEGRPPDVPELFCEGREEAARDLLAAHVRSAEASRSYFRAGDIARLYVLLGDRDQALQWLERAFAAREATFSWLTSPAWDQLREDPRYADLLRRTEQSPLGDQ